MKKPAKKDPAAPKGVVLVRGQWDDERKRLPFPYEEVRGKAVRLHYYVTPETRQICDARASVGKTIEGWLNHGAVSVFVEECPGIFCPACNPEGAKKLKADRASRPRKGGAK